MIPAAAESSTWAFKAAAAAAASPQKEKQPRPPALDKAALAQQLPPSTSARTAWGDSPLGAGAVRIPAWRGEAAAAEEGDENRAPSAGAPSVSKAGLRSRSAAEPALPPPPPTTFAPDSRECWTFSCSGWLFVYTFGEGGMERPQLRADLQSAPSLFFFSFDAHPARCVALQFPPPHSHYTGSLTSDTHIHTQAW